MLQWSACARASRTGGATNARVSETINQRHNTMFTPGFCVVGMSQRQVVSLLSSDHDVGKHKNIYTQWDFIIYVMNRLLKSTGRSETSGGN